ncbi:hypothetical protein ACFXJ8_38115 [Nonomuraea sp. NPDC059194]|uniref:hypothetical protein n=1 Tax=Nonomuraea sp. NPDC059194 TaxID=3346764 RepID=UPI00367A97F3
MTQRQHPLEATFAQFAKGMAILLSIWREFTVSNLSIFLKSRRKEMFNIRDN